MMRSLWIVLLSATLGTWACSGSDEDPRPVGDTGMADTGGGGGSGTDTGGEEDAVGEEDTGSFTDTGSRTDTGPIGDAISIDDTGDEVGLIDTGDDTGAIDTGDDTGGDDTGDDTGGDDTGGDTGEGLTPEDFVGEWTGGWFNETFESEGDASMNIGVDGTTVSVTIDLDGSVFGGVDPEPETLTGTVDGASFTVEATTELFGPMSLTFGADGTVSGTAQPAGFDKMDFDGTGSATEIALRYEIFWAEASEREDDLFAEGTLTFTRAE